jgi:hypothetical protein
MAGTIAAQECQPYWTTLPLLSLPGNPQIKYVPLTLADGPQLFAFSSFTSRDELYRWSGVTWQEVTRNGIPESLGINDLHALDDGNGIRLYAQTYTTGLQATRYATLRAYKLVGDTWHPMPFNFWPAQFQRPYLSADFGDGTHIYGIDYFGVPSRWDGDRWTQLGLGPTVQPPNLAAAHDGTGLALFAFGGLWQLNGQTSYGFAKWDGSTWSLPITGVFHNSYSNFPATCAVTFDDGTGPAMYSVRGFHPGSTNYPCLYRFRNNQWSVAGWPMGTPTSFTGGQVLTIFDDGRGPAIYVAGSFNDVNGVPAKHIARWDGRTWEPLGPGLLGGFGSSSVHMGTINDASGHSLVIAGNVVYAGGGSQGKWLLKWVGCPNCYADCDLSGGSPRLTANDFLCFITKYAAKDPYANCNLDNAINAADFQCFLNRYAAGCS